MSLCFEFDVGATLFAIHTIQSSPGRMGKGFNIIENTPSVHRSNLIGEDGTGGLICSSQAPEAFGFGDRGDLEGGLGVGDVDPFL